MQCEEIRKLLSDFIDGELGDEERGMVESHLVGCTACRRQVYEFKKTISLVSVPGKVLVVGITGDRINLLDTLDEDTVRQQMATVEKKSFGPLLTDRLKQLGRGWKGEGER